MFLIQLLVWAIVQRFAYSMISNVEEQLKNEYEKRCMDLVAVPNFKDEMVIGTVWSVYFNWYVKLENGCLTVTFKKATDKLKRRFQKIINSRIKWSEATLHLNMTWTQNGTSSSMEALLLPVQTENGEGLFQSVRIVDDAASLFNLDQLPKVAIAMKLFSNGRHLIIQDCNGGATSLLVRKDQKHTYKEIDDIIDLLNYNAPGSPVCKYGSKRRDGQNAQ